MTSIAQVESGFAPLLIGVNGTGRNVVAPSTKAEAVEIAYDLIARGRNIDLGLAQINSRNLAGLGLSVEGAFDPCSNLAAAARVLDRSYVLALRTGGSSQPILQMAYSVYNTGRVDRGLENGYVGKIEQVQRLAIAR